MANSQIEAGKTDSIAVNGLALGGETLIAPTDLDELERLLERATPDLLAKRGFEISCNLIETIPAMLTEIRELRAENARLKWWQDEVLKLQSDHYGNGVMTHLRLSEFCDDARAMRALAALGEPQ